MAIAVRAMAGAARRRSNTEVPTSLARLTTRRTGLALKPSE